MKDLNITKNKISVIIAAYNEEPRIANVLKIVEHHPLIDEVIVVNDGSKDKTSEVVHKFKDVKLIENEHNMGKTLSVKRGIEASKNDLIMLLDADLKGLTSGAIEKLASPVLNGDVDWTLSLRSNSGGIMKLLKMDWISGERVAPKKMLLDKMIWSRPDVGFGLETLMNKSFLATKKPFRSVYLPTIKITRKSEKIGFIAGWKGEFKMIRQICKVLPLHKVIGQFLTMAYYNNKKR